MRIERRRSKKEEDRKAEVQVVNNIYPTDYADVLTMAGGEIGVERMYFGLVPSWAKVTKAEVGKKFGHMPNAIADPLVFAVAGLDCFKVTVSTLQKLTP